MKPENLNRPGIGGGVGLGDLNGLWEGRRLSRISHDVVDIDPNLIALLQRDARMTVAVLAKRLSVSQK